jgi:Protein of unknown function (DUF3365)
MKTAVVLLCAPLLIGAAWGESDQKRAHESRMLAKRFADALNQALQQSLRERGPLGTIEVCASDAPAIAERLSAESGWQIRRTALMLTNPTNAPDAWESSVLEYFERSRRMGADLIDLEFFSIIDEEDQTKFRFMKPVPMGPLCLVCHGKNVPREVSDAIDARYPGNRGKGFSLGDVRGAVSVFQSY